MSTVVENRMSKQYLESRVNRQMHKQHYLKLSAKDFPGDIRYYYEFEDRPHLVGKWVHKVVQRGQATTYEVIGSCVIDAILESGDHSDLVEISGLRIGHMYRKFRHTTGHRVMIMSEPASGRNISIIST